MRRGVWIGILVAISAGLRAEPVAMRVAPNPAPRVAYGIERVRGVEGDKVPLLVIGRIDEPHVREQLAAARIELKAGEPGREGFLLAGGGNAPLIVAGADDSGTLYGCLELAARIRDNQGHLPREPLRVADQPVFVLRGPCIGMQKPYILPGRHVYEYPYTSDLFPFFYDRAFWREYLDFLAENRMNTLYLWNGHPFASLVKLPEYPEALEVSEEQFRRNVEMFRFITAECDRRGIWLVQMFYNILLPKPLAEKHGIDSQLRAPTPLAADYTRKAIAAFVRDYPNVGLMPCLGEALSGTPNQIKWATETILPGVHDGMQAAGLTREPPVVFRTHAMDPEAIMPAAFKVYANLFTETKFNGESLTTWEPRGKGQATHLAMAKLGPHLINVHILSNLEPFRYGATDFIRKSMLAARDRLGATGLHLYPLAYWNWPDAPDKVSGGTTGLKQWDRDWIWFEAWARYAWNPDRLPVAEHAYWVERLTERFGSADAAPLILEGYNAMGECAPRIIRRFGITEGNRQTMSLGMTLDELVNPEKYGVLPDLWESQSPPGERLQDYVEKELKHQTHEGETPPQIVREVDEFSRRAVERFESAAALVKKNTEEFARLRNDAACIRALSLSYGAKANAALHVLRFKRTSDVTEMEQAREFLRRSLEEFRTLERLTRDTYRFANSMQTAQRRIPVVGGVGGQPANYHWSQLLPLYEKEFADFDAQVTALKTGGAAAVRAKTLATLRAVPFTVHTPNSESYTLKAGARVFADAPFTIEELATELEGLRGYKFPRRAIAEQPPEISVNVPVRVLIGYVKSDAPEWRRPPRSEFDAAAAERGGTEPLLVNAAKISGLSGIDVYELALPAGRHKIDPPGTGAFLVLGVVAADAP
jgi:hypothetical protein